MTRVNGTIYVPVADNPDGLADWIAFEDVEDVESMP